MKKLGYEAIVINNNPETVSTDYAVADKLYFEPLSVEDILHVVQKERAEGVIVQFGGQTAINLAKALEEEGIKIFGTSTEAVHAVEDREEFYQMLNVLEVPHIPGRTVNHQDELKSAAVQIGYPIIVRPSYVIGGQSMYIFHNDDDLVSFIESVDWLSGNRPWPLLVDRFIPGTECEVDVISDGETIIIPGIFEHIERAGVHSGDSVSIYPPLSLSSEQKAILVDYSKRIASHLQVIGMMNIQFVLDQDVVYVLEVNPRSSRTVPIISKITGIPMVEWATRVQLGDTLTSLHSEQGLLPEISYYAVKTPVFSAGKLKGVDHILGPEMKSTGEVLGMGKTPEEAFEKSLFHGGSNPFRLENTTSYVLCSLSDRDKEDMLPSIKQMHDRGFQILATEGTASYLAEKGVPVRLIDKNMGSIEKTFKDSEIAAVINTPTLGRVKDRFGFSLREMATKYSLPCYTHTDTVRAALALPTITDRRYMSVDEYHALSKVSI